MEILILILTILGCILLIGAILIQNSKGGGLASNVGISNQLLGAKKEADIIENVTWGLMGFIVVLCLASGFAYTTPENTNSLEPMVKTPEKVVPVAPNAPTAPTAPFQQ